MSRFARKTVILCLLLLLLIVFSLCIGRYPLTPAEIVAILTGNPPSAMAQTVLLSVRIPRILLVVVSGGALSLAGLVFQSLFQNPLASPDVLGVSSGCSVGAALAILAGGNGLAMQLAPFSAGLLTVLLTAALARLMRGSRLFNLLIAGVVVSSLASAAIMALKTVADPNRQLPAIDFWMMGGFHNAGWEQVTVLLPLIAAPSLLLILLRWRLKILTLGEEEARALGVRTSLVRGLAVMAATLLVSTVVSAAGVVSWIGLIAPHAIRLYAGEDSAKTLPLSMVGGGILLLFADTLSRSLFPSELPVSILTSAIGAVFLVVLLSCRGRQGILPVKEDA